MATQQTRAEREASDSVSLFPLGRFFHAGTSSYRCYYPYGNTPAEDYLENCVGERKPSVLVLGCGDLRSCFYTIWKNLDPSISDATKRFDGVHFTLNDYSPAILARNILFLYLCLRLPEYTTERKKWLSSMWAIWYCHELHPEHAKLLDDSLKTLLQFSGSLELWSSGDNLLSQYVKFSSSACLVYVSQVWTMWLRKTVSVKSVKDMQKSRSKVQLPMLNDISEYCHNLTKDNVLIHGEEEHATLEKVHARSPEVKSYLASGNCYAEHVFHLPIPKKAQHCVNLTMFERQDGMYSCNCGVPFISYYHTVEFSFQKFKFNLPSDDVLVSPTSFESKPFLSNSVQQFSMWIQSTNRVLKQKKNAIAFSVDCQDAITFCRHMQQKWFDVTDEEKEDGNYDIVTTSNVMDHTGPVNLVLSSLPLLKQNGLLITMTMNCRFCTNTREEFLDMCFGLDCKMFPIVLGVRCINLEGSVWASSVMTKPTLPDLSHLRKKLPHNRVFLWDKVGFVQPLVISRLPNVVDGNITEALINAVGITTYALLNHSPGNGKSVICYHGVETALLILKQFTSLCDASAYEYSFWEPLCTALNCVGKPFLHCLQTQLLLNNFHFHLTVSEKNCPLCRNEPLENTLGLFCTSLPPNIITTQFETPFFYGLVHRSSSFDCIHLKNEAKEGRDVHIFDYFDAKVSNGIIQLNFFAPLTFLQNDYKVTVVRCLVQQKFDVIEDIICTTSLKLVKAPLTGYSFVKPEKMPPSCSALNTNICFGTISSHTCDGNKSKTKVSLSNETQKAVSTYKVSIDKVAENEVKFLFGSSHFSLKLPYPIDFDMVNMTFTQDTMTVDCNRQGQKFYEERPHFVVSPDHVLSLPPTDVNMRIIFEQSSMQMTNEDIEALKMIQTPTTKVKLTLPTLFATYSTGFKLFHFVSPNQEDYHGLVVVNEVLFDYQHRTPAIDLAFYFMNHSNEVMESWEKNISPTIVKSITISEKEFQLLYETFSHFAKRTNGSLQSASCKSYLILRRFNLDHVFSRAVVYLLFCDPDVKLYGSGEEYSFMENFKQQLDQVGGVKCSYCGKLSFTTKKCGNCKMENYCSKSCQASHWVSHKTKCHKRTYSAEQSRKGTSYTLSQCAYCNNEMKDLKKCSQCKSVGYCSKTCQEKHWSEHKEICQNKKTLHSNESTVQLPRCSHCSSDPEKLLKCARCRKVQYCTRLCQQKHWPEHRKSCVSEETKRAAISTCAYCLKTSDSLRKCTRCQAVCYCDKECQQNHWSEHRLNCKKKN